MGNLYSEERQQQYIKYAVEDIKQLEKDGVPTDDMWQGIYGFFLDAHFGHDLSKTLAIKAFRNAGYSVGE